jgi:hypothetical protein
VLNTDLADPPPLRCPECQLSAWRTLMRKLIITGLAAASLLIAASAANAAVCGWTPWGYICEPTTCYYDVFGRYFCG